MKGQWIGTYSGSNEGMIVVNIDEMRSCFQGIAYLNERNENLPHTATYFITENKDKAFRFRTQAIVGLNRYTGAVSSRDDFGKDVRIPTYADVEGRWDDETLYFSWTTDIGTNGSCTLPKSQADKPSKCIVKDKNWTSYKDYVSNLEGKRYLYRGQNGPWRLRTSFHRTGRANLNRFIQEDIQILHKHLSARTRHIFNLDIPNENGAFYNLVQHHGYPTPLLDWTYSPYVAAFFAYRGISNRQAEKSRNNKKVRITVFDQELWRQSYNQIHQLIIPGLHVSIHEFASIENERMIPQQAASMVTNVDDIEKYIMDKGIENSKYYLWAIDLPVRERKKVIEELNYMGITAGSLFPGLDGACEELKERNFEI